MKKADMLEEIICELSLLQKEFTSKTDWYDTLIHQLKKKVSHYSTVAIYLTDDTSFHYFNHESDANEDFEQTITFGEGVLSKTAAKGEITCEFNPSGQELYVPFYDGHRLLGELVIKTNQFINEDDIKFLEYIQKLLG